MRIVICEDEQHHLAVIERIISKWAGTVAEEVTLDTYKSAESFLKDYQRGQTYDLAFLDIQMGDMNGMDLAQQIRRKDMGMLIVFVTNFFEYVTKAFEVDAFRFLRKPIKERDCINALNAAAERLKKRSMDAFTVQTENGALRIEKSDILYFESQRHYIECHTTQGVYRFRENLSILEEEFSVPWFFRCHRSYLVNLAHVYCILQRDVILSNDEKLPVSRYKYNEFNACFLSVHVNGESPGNHIVIN